MKVLKLPQNTQHLVLLEEDDRFVQLEGLQTAVVLDQPEGDDIKVTVHFPKLADGDDVPLSVLLAACVREFLDDVKLVQEMQSRIQEKQAKKQT